jgi:hypothetical protein
MEDNDDGSNKADGTSYLPQYPQPFLEKVCTQYRTASS